ncbi:oxygen-independent coproporphyrinogen-III oxidase-like protein [Gottschalkia purinilytica]|uniref:Heme chaperone HemW n=1 Tax=Gottschalkia purinilytica TaxID=1503 RepID=A0A0L0WAD1_GOTPU|nr:coproporphyrinogen-III oxidase family protein [Gottschalkia purinilytica]KNF08280.1 oxygen-independent coproporphyrinogen-III oxidase-like protein [Gottschalkia purinilytica]
MFKERAKSHHASHGMMMSYFRGKKSIGEHLQEAQTGDKENAIYLHVPFCNKICTFCTMRRSLCKPSEDYADLVVREIEYYAKQEYIKSSKYKSVYFGGGTPTTLDADELEKILKALNNNLNIEDNAEVSIETTITELTEDKLNVFKENGVNRFSIGIQTFNDRGRIFLGRKGTGKTACEKIQNMKEMGFKNINVDLIYNYPDEDTSELLYDLDTIFSLDLGGFSFYSLIMMENSLLKNKNVNENDKDLEFFNTIYNKSLSNGFSLLELTKLVNHDNYEYIRARHKGADTLAIGAAAGGNFGNLVYANPGDIDKYREYVENIEKNNAEGMLMDSKYKKISQLVGCIQECYIPICEYEDILKEEVRGFLDELLEKEYLVKKNNKYNMTPKGVYWGNNICVEIMKYIK